MKMPTKKDEFWRYTDPSIFEPPQNMGIGSFTFQLNGNGASALDRLELPEIQITDFFRKFIMENASEGHKLKFTGDGESNLSIEFNGRDSITFNLYAVEGGIHHTVRRNLSNKSYGKTYIFDVWVLKENSTLILIDHEDHGEAKILREELFLFEEHSYLELIRFTKNGDVLKNTSDFKLMGNGASLSVFVLNESNSHQDIVTRVEQSGISTGSDIELRGIVRNGFSLHHGLVSIKNGAKGSKSYVKSHHLVLSESGRGFSIPKLEIDEEEVEAGHGATVKTIDSDELYYLMTRGLGKPQAEELIVEGFKWPVMSRLVENHAKHQG